MKNFTFLSISLAMCITASAYALETAAVPPSHPETPAAAPPSAPSAADKAAPAAASPAAPVTLAGKVVGQSLTDDDRVRQTVDEFLNDLEQQVAN